MPSMPKAATKVSSRADVDEVSAETEWLKGNPMKMTELAKWMEDHYINNHFFRLGRFNCPPRYPMDGLSAGLIVLQDIPWIAQESSSNETTHSRIPGTP